MNNGRLSVEYTPNPPYGKTIAVCITVSDTYAEVFQKVAVTDSAMDAFITGAIHSNEYRHRLKSRAELAKLLSAQITEFIIEIMANQDTFNGYPMEGKIK